MLFADGGGQTQRLHGPFVSDEEIQAVAEALSAQRSPDYVAGIAELPEEDAHAAQPADTDEDELLAKAIEMVASDQRASISYLQRRFSIGYNRAGRLLDRMEALGIVSAADSAGRRTVRGSNDDAAAEPTLL